MAAGLFKAPTSNFWSSSLNGAINDSVQTITLNSTSGLQSPGYIIIDRENSSTGTATPNAREIVKYTGISGSDLTGCTRGADNSTARSHTDGALVEAVPTIGMWNDQRDAINAEHTVAGLHSIIANATITTANVGTLNAAVNTFVSGQFYWSRSGALATVRNAVASDTHFPLQRATKNLTINNVFLSVCSAPSLFPLKVDISWASGPTGDFVSIFTTCPLIAIGEYVTSSATPGTLSLVSLASGIVLRHEILNPGGAGTVMTQLKVTER